MNFPALKHFVLPKDTTGNFKAKCRHCSVEYKGSLNVTSNFITHLKKKHREVLFESTQPSSTVKGQNSLDGFMTENSTSQKYSPSDPRQMMINDALVSFIAGDLISLSVVESANFKNLLSKLHPKYKIPTRKTLTTSLLHAKCSEMRKDIMLEMKTAQNICLTLDLWSNRQMRSFLGVTGHYISQWQMKSVMIACCRFKGRHTGEAIRRVYDETVACFEIGHKISNVVTDNASNMVKAFNFCIPGFEKQAQTEDSDDEDPINGLSDECSQDSDSSEEFELLPNHCSCFAHTLQLVVRDGIGDCGSHLRQLIAKASSIVNHVRKSINASDILEDERRLQAANSTRWNSQFYMLKSILRIQSDKLEKLDCPNLTAYERKLLHEVCSILEPFEEVTLAVQKESSVSASLAIPLILGLRNKLQSISSTYNTKMVNTLKTSAQKRLKKYEENEDYIFAAILDPRFKLSWCLKEDERNEHIEQLRAKISSYEETTDDTSPQPKKQKTESSSIFSFIPQTPKRQRHTSGRITELDKYLAEDCEKYESDPLAYWSVNEVRLPTLSKLAIQYLALPASSAPVERLFSIAGKVFRPDRCNMSDKNFEALMFVKCNKTL